MRTQSSLYQTQHRSSFFPKCKAHELKVAVVNNKKAEPKIPFFPSGKRLQSLLYKVNLGIFLLHKLPIKTVEAFGLTGWCLSIFSTVDMIFFPFSISSLCEKAGKSAGIHSLGLNQKKIYVFFSDSLGFYEILPLFDEYETCK